MSIEKGDPVTIQIVGKPVAGTVYSVETNRKGKIIGVRVQIPGMVVYRKVSNGRIV